MGILDPSLLVQTCKHSHTSPASHTPAIHPLKRFYYVLVINASLASLIELVGEDIQHQFRIAFRIDMPMCFEVKEML